jgi:hypothetical protein
MYFAMSLRLRVTDLCKYHRKLVLRTKYPPRGGATKVLVWLPGGVVGIFFSFFDRLYDIL